ncbi:MAG TPA: IS200/IS605 family transposase [Gemmatimonadales bacterium]|nr:IS200/IS605 family transposase [Gemmatimonadales bacterium]
MAGTYSRLNFHIVFSTWRHQRIIASSWRADLHAFLGGTLRTVNAVGLAIGGPEDHVHILAGLRPVHRLSDIVRDLKHASSKWVHEEIHLQSFRWQEGYGAFTVGHREVEVVTRYIRNQVAHHRRVDFEAEYLHFLQRNEVDYQREYVF